MNLFKDLPYIKASNEYFGVHSMIIYRFFRVRAHPVIIYGLPSARAEDKGRDSLAGLLCRGGTVSLLHPAEELDRLSVQGRESELGNRANDQGREHGLARADPAVQNQIGPFADNCREVVSKTTASDLRFPGTGIHLTKIIPPDITIPVTDLEPVEKRRSITTAGTRMVSW